MITFREYKSQSLVDTKQLAAKIADASEPGMVFALIGNLGTGKTVFSQGFAEAMGVSENVGSPTFKLISEYDGASHKLFHIDCYRLENPQEFLNIGGELYLYPEEGVTLIEWADIIQDILPQDTIIIRFKRIMGKNSSREIAISKVDDETNRN